MRHGGGGCPGRSHGRPLETEFTKQRLWSGNLEALEALPLPGIETIDHMDASLQSADHRVSQIRADMEASDVLGVDIDGQIRGLELTQEVPTEEDLLSARGRRETGWKLIRDLLETGKAPEPGVAAFVQTVEGHGTLADTYESAVRTADTISDRLRREADRVTKKARLLAERETRERHLERLKKNLKEAEQVLAGVRDVWRDLWSPMGISPRSPREMRARVQHQHALAEKASSLRNRARKATALRARIDQERWEMGRALLAASEPPEAATETLAALIRRGRRAVDQNEAIRDRREQLTRDIQQGTSQQKELTWRRDQIQTEMGEWETEWAKAIQPLGLVSDAGPEQASAIMEDSRICLKSERMRRSSPNGSRVSTGMRPPFPKR